MAFSLFNFFIQIWLLKCQNERLKCQNGLQKYLNWQHAAQYLLPIKWCFKNQNIGFIIFMTIKNTGVKVL